MNLFIETPQQAAERMAREHERQLDELRVLSSQQTYAAPPATFRQGFDALGGETGAWGERDPVAGASVLGAGRSPAGWTPYGVGRDAVLQGGCAPSEGLASPAAPAFAHPEVPFAGGDEYWAEKRFDRGRRARRAAARVARVVFAVLLVPIVLVAVFVGAYSLTCIMNGASPEELVGLLGELAGKASAFLREAFG